jgi:hypothetical protein
VKGGEGLLPAAVPGVSAAPERVQYSFSPSRARPAPLQLLKVRELAGDPPLRHHEVMLRVP